MIREASSPVATLSPAHASGNLVDGITEYLTTSFSLADRGTSEALQQFLGGTAHSMFRGPYVRTRLPYAPAENWRGLLSWVPEWFTPYRHQAEAFHRLRSHDGFADRRPSPTLVVTGTGSGKTEAFLYPVLDHALRRRARGETGIKALILYPMNALANDQADRLARLLTGDPRLKGVTAGLYTGEADRYGASAVTEASLITNRETLRATPPDILLTNYKMLDQLLLREEDRPLWAASAESLQYLVLDEFHTYDGAQGTDVSLLLRRLGLMLRDSAPDRFAGDRPLGEITPVATSATLGDRGDTARIREFARTVFGEEFPETSSDRSVVTETMLSVDGWIDTVDGEFPAVSDAVPTTVPANWSVTAELIRAVNEQVAAVTADGVGYTDAVRTALTAQPAGHSASDEYLGLTASTDLGDQIRSWAHHPLCRAMLESCVVSRPLRGGGKDRAAGLVEAVVPAAERRSAGDGAAAEFLTHVLTYMAWLRSELGATASPLRGKLLPGVETHLWIREVSHIDRRVGLSSSPGEMFRWSDDGPTAVADDPDVDLTEPATWLPACHCRNCGRSGWMVSLEPGTGTPVLDPGQIRATSFEEKERHRPLFTAFDELAAGAPVQWLDPELGTLSPSRPAEDRIDTGLAVPVLTYTGENAADLARDEACPSCGDKDSVRYLGSSVATLLSVALSNLFGMPGLDAGEKKTLVFTDSVQDAAHRAAFVQSRSRAFALRTFARRALGTDSAGDDGEAEGRGTVRLSELPARLVGLADARGTAVDVARSRFELLPPELARSPRFRGFWDPEARPKDRREHTVGTLHRLGFDLALEFGQRADLPRSLSLTGSATVRVDADPTALHTAADRALSAVAVPLSFDGTDNAGDDHDTRLAAWARGVVETVRARGGIDHPWFTGVGYLSGDCNPYLLNRRTSRAMGIPAFPRGGAPEFPRSGPALTGAAARNNAVTPVESARGRYARWTARLFGLSTHDAATAVTALFTELADAGVLTATATGSRGTVYAVAPEKVLLSIEDTPGVLECTVCHRQTGLAAEVRDVLTDRPCTAPDCTGHLRSVPVEDNYYRNLYRASEPRTVIAAEHTSILPTDERLAVEDAFKQTADTAPADAPNVLVATPTLEMGIDIGDLSTVMLSSLPTSVASYVQRVGRAGRLTGNSLVLAMVRGRGVTLPKLDQPLSVINGTVTPPAAYLSAVDILHRQFLARWLDSLDPSAAGTDLSDGRSVFGGGPGNPDLIEFLLDRLEGSAGGVATVLDGFLASLPRAVATASGPDLRDWIFGTDRTRPTWSLSGELVAAKDRWRADTATFRSRVVTLEKMVGLLQQRTDSTAGADEDGRRELRETESALRHAHHQLGELQKEHWISALERAGLLPNFTLLDDMVELTVTVTQMDPTTLELSHTSRDYSRGAAVALQELAPGATFYAQGIAATIDAVEIGHEGADIEQWRVCPNCSHLAVEHPGTALPPACPACGAPGWADKSQLVPTLPLRKVSAQVDRGRAGISDITDDRRRTWFTVRLFLDVPENGEGASWSVPGGLGATHLHRVDLHWMNLGTGPGAEKTLGGDTVAAPLFRVCSECGHTDSEAGANSRWDHRPWCSKRNDLEESTVDFALGRSMTTEGVLLYLPPLVARGDSLTVTSLIAAVRLGVTTVLGGAPEHLDVSTVTVGNGDGSTTEALLLHDTVPGGTGYLTRFADPAAVHDLLLAAYRKVRDCTCAAEEDRDGARDCCPSCLLPYASLSSLNSTSRAVAEHALEKLLTGVDHLVPDGDPEAPMEQNWDVSETKPAGGSEGSALELRFRTMFRDALRDRNARVEERTERGRIRLDFTVPGTSSPWHLQEQTMLGATQPDFLLTNDRPGVRSIAVYLDGRAYHASERNFTLPEDIAKRTRLYTEPDNYLPWSLTWHDLDIAADTAASPAPAWFEPVLQPKLVGKLKVGRTRLDVLAHDPFTQLIDLLADADPDYWDRLSQAAVMHVIARGQKTAAGTRLRQLTPQVAVERVSGHRADLSCALPEQAGESRQTLPEKDWELFLSLANLLWLRATGASVTVTGAGVGSGVEDLPVSSVRDTPAVTADTLQVVGTTASPEDAEVPATAAGAETSEEDATTAAATAVTIAWRNLLAEFEGEDDVTGPMAVLADAGVPAPAIGGDEIDDGVMVAMAWPEARITVAYDDLTADDAEALSNWNVLTLSEITAGHVPEVLTDLAPTTT